MKKKPILTNSKKNIFHSTSYSSNDIITCKTQPAPKTDQFLTSRKIFHSPEFSNVSAKISSFDPEIRKLSIQFENLFSPDTNLMSPYINKPDPNRKIKFFIPNFRESDSKFLQKIKTNYEKKFQLINDAEDKRFNTSSHEDASYTKYFPLRNNEKFKSLINFVEINTSKGDDRSVELKENNNNVMQIHRYDFNYFCIYTKGKVSPLVINLKTQECDALKVYSSDSFRFPSRFNCDKCFESKFIKLFSKNQKKEFESKYNYFCLISEVSQEITINMKFGDIQMGVSNCVPRSPQKKKQFISIDSVKTPQLREQIKYIKKKRLERMIKISKISMNKVEFNKSQILTNFTPEFQSKIRYRKKQETIMKTERVEERKAQFDVTQLNKKNFEIIKHDLAKNCLTYYRNVQNQLNHISQWKKNWILIIFCTIFEKYIADYTKNKYYEKKKLLQVAFGIQKFQIRYRKFQREIGADQTERFKWETKAGLMFHYSMGKKIINRKMKNLIADLIKNNVKKLEFIEKLHTYYDKVLKIKRKWKEYRMKIKYFKILIHKLWNKYFQIFAMSMAEKNFENMDQTLRRKTQTILNKMNDTQTRTYYIDKYFHSLLLTFQLEMRKHIELQSKYTDSKKATKQELIISRMFLRENDNLYDKIDYMKKMSVFGSKSHEEKKHKEEEDFILDEDDEEEKDLELNFPQYAKKEKDIDVLRRPRLFILPNIEKLKDMIRDSISQILVLKSPPPISPTYSYNQL